MLTWSGIDLLINVVYDNPEYKKLFNATYTDLELYSLRELLYFKEMKRIPKLFYISSLNITLTLHNVIV